MLVLSFDLSYLVTRMTSHLVQVILVHLCDDIFELALFPGVCWVVHHGDDSIVILLVLVVQKHQLCPEVGLLCCPEYLKHKHRVKFVYILTKALIYKRCRQM